MRNQYKRRAVWLKRPFPTPVGQLGEEEEEAWGPPPPLPGSPRGAAMAMVIMSPLSELTDTDGFEMHSASQWAPALPAPPTPPPSPIPGSVRPLCWVLSYPGVTARPSSTAQPGSSFLKRLFACFGEGGGWRLFWVTSGPLLLPPHHELLFFLLPQTLNQSWPQRRTMDCYSFLK